MPRPSPTAPSCQLVTLPQLSNVPIHASSSLLAGHISMSPKHPEVLFPEPGGAQMTSQGNQSTEKTAQT